MSRHNKEFAALAFDKSRLAFVRILSLIFVFALYAFFASPFLFGEPEILNPNENNMQGTGSTSIEEINGVEINNEYYNELFGELNRNLYSDNNTEAIIDAVDVVNEEAGVPAVYTGADGLWRHFLETDDSSSAAIEILVTLGMAGKGNRSIINNLNNYLIDKNLLVKSGVSVNYTLVSACISAIMELGDSSSYQALFSAYCAGYPEVIASEAYGAMEIIPGNFYQFLLNVLWNNPPDEKFAAFRAGINSERLSVSDKGQIAELALEQALASNEDNINLNVMRYAAVSVLTRLRWTRANALAIRHYYRVQADFHADKITKERFLEAVNCLGAVGNSQAALVLGLQLGLINDRMAHSGSFDAEVTLAIVHALGLIGDNAAFDHLLYVLNLSYPYNIHAAAREAIDNLKWVR